jgi:hypothetical protein
MPVAAMDVAAWVPRNCKLFLTFDPAAGEWTASLRLAHDYLGYLVTERDADPQDAIVKAHAAYLAGHENPQGLDSARAIYFRQVMAPMPAMKLNEAPA